MKVIQLSVPGGPEVLRLVECALPEPAANEVRVRAQAIGISSADILVRNGTYKWMPPLPAVPGNELVGVIDAKGAEVSGLQLGQKVLVSSRELPQRGGCYAQAICVPAAALYLLPDSIAPHDAVSLPNYQLAGALLYDSGVRKPETIVVYGASGGVGSALIQLARSDGIRAIGIVSSEKKRAFARAAGAEDVLIRGEDNVRDEVMALTGARGVDVVYAMAGKDLMNNLDLLAPLGTLVSFSTLGGKPGKDVFAALRARLGKSLGVRCYSIHTLDQQPVTRRALMQRAIDLMAAGRLSPPAPTLLPLAEARRAHELMEAGETLGKLVLVPA
ncbi:MAG TPA: zinc-dependent alcohol dehydrogenase family protein [Burkholderiales bacterium]|nr:zinc-dependent alcohol dehydrogenase family protein [Burkholderiales bacterium]